MLEIRWWGDRVGILPRRCLSLSLLYRRYGWNWTNGFAFLGGRYENATKAISLSLFSPFERIFLSWQRVSICWVALVKDDLELSRRAELSVDNTCQSVCMKTRVVGER